MKLPSKRYLGDAVYVRHDGFGIVLTTEDGIRATNTIVMEPSVIHNFEEWIAEVKKAIAEASMLVQSEEVEDIFRDGRK